MRIIEDFLHFIWQFRLYTSKNLFTSTGSRIEILNTGVLNKNSGPDFDNAKLIIDGTVWAGHVEIHVKASEWMRHGHHYDAAYDNVILHVVYEYDQSILRKDGTIVPVLVVSEILPLNLLNKYNDLITASNNFPCEKQIGGIDQLHINNFLSRMMIDRLEKKAEDVYGILNRNKGNWNDTFYMCLAKNFGFKVNLLPFELLAASLNLRVLAKHKDRAGQIEAMIFGQAGFLEQDFDSSYPQELKAEYSFLSKKYGFQHIDVSLWKFLRMRPQNFPTVRLAQFAALILKSSHLFSRILETANYKELFALFEDLPVNEYWKEHYHFNKKTTRLNVQIGKDSINNIIINTICPLLFVYGKCIDNPQYTDRAIYFLENIPAEKNAIISLYEACGLKIDNAYLSQALLQLNKNYCTEKKCLNCNIGIKILKK